MRHRITITLLLGSLCNVLSASAQPVDLKLISALPVSGLDNAQPSGLCWVDGNLYAVSDHHDHTICRLELLEDEEGFVFVGAGSGNGVGMSQWGARAMARRGDDYREILSAFYPGTTITKPLGERGETR